MIKDPSKLFGITQHGSVRGKINNVVLRDLLLFLTDLCSFHGDEIAR